MVGAALQAIGDPAFMLHGPATSTGGSALMVIVNGPIARGLESERGRQPLRPRRARQCHHRADVAPGPCSTAECRRGALETRCRAGRASIALLRRGRDEILWEPVSVSRGVPAGRSAVTVYAAESGHNVLSHGTGDPERLLAVRRRPGRARQPEPGPVRDRLRARARAAPPPRRLDAAGYSSGSTSTPGARWPTSSAEARSSPPSTPTLSLVDWLYRDAPGGRPDPPPEPEDADRVAPGDEAGARAPGPRPGGHPARGGRRCRRRPLRPSSPRGAAALRPLRHQGGAGMTRILDPTLTDAAARRRSCLAPQGPAPCAASPWASSPTASPTAWRC